MLGDSVHHFDNSCLNRFYLSTMADFYPLKGNAFETLRKRIHQKKLRLLDTIFEAQTLGAPEGNNVVQMFGSQARGRRSDRVRNVQPHSQLSWKVHYFRGVEVAKAG